MEEFLMDNKYETVAIVASGPSLLRKDCEKLIDAGIPIIAVNTSWKMVPECDIIYAGDKAWWQSNHMDVPVQPEWWTSSLAWYQTQRSEATPRECKYFNSTTYRNSGAKAIKLAEILGAKKVILLGFDCSLSNGTHWHGNHTKTKNPTPQSVSLWKEDFRHISTHCRYDMTIINCSRYTEIDSFKKLSIDDAINYNKKYCIIVGSGPSAKNFIPPDDCCIISINASIQWLQRADYWFSLDDSPSNIDLAKNRRMGTRYITAGWKRNIPNVTNLERISEDFKEPKPRNTPKWWLWRWKCKLGLSEDNNKVHTGNSAYGALNLAKHLGFEHVAVIGVDATNETKIEGGKSKNLDHLPILFESALTQIDVVSLGKLNSIPQMTLEEWLLKMRNN